MSIRRAKFSDGRIIIVVGEIGAGKTWFAVDYMLRHIASGGIVYTNIELKLEPWWSVRFRRRMCGVYQYLWQEFQWPMQDGQYHHIPGSSIFQHLTETVHVEPGKRVLVVIDEALEGWDSLRSSRSELSAIESSLSFLRHSRKYGCEVMIISQALSEITSRVRTKATDIVVVRDMGRFVVPRLGIRLPGCGKIIWVQWRDGSGKYKVENQFLSRSRPVGECYDTTQTLSLTVRSPEIRQSLELVDYRSHRMRWVFLGGLSGAIVFLFFFLLLPRFFLSRTSVDVQKKKMIPLFALAPSNSLIRVCDPASRVVRWWMDGELFEPGRTTRRGLVVYSDRTGFLVRGDGTNYVYIAPDFFF